jgi:steroid 5-alpha reductase family enzyme
MTATVLFVNGVALVALFLVAWGISIRIQKVSFVDTLWALGMVAMALSTSFQANGDPVRMALLTGLCTIWGLRLGSHLIGRFLREGEDPRYQKMFANAQSSNGWSFARFSLQTVFALQLPLLFVVCLPVQLGQIDAAPAVGAIGWAGAALAAFGIAFETIGDAQLKAFRADPASAGQVMDRGLWRYTRHPNYFGDACAWWGMGLIAAETATGLWALIGPLLLTWLLTKLSGVPMLEKRLTKHRPGYADYVKRTSGFIPWPPKG